MEAAASEQTRCGGGTNNEYNCYRIPQRAKLVNLLQGDVSFHHIKQHLDYGANEDPCQKFITSDDLVLAAMRDQFNLAAAKHPQLKGTVDILTDAAGYLQPATSCSWTTVEAWNIQLGKEKGSNPLNVAAFKQMSPLMLASNVSYGGHHSLAVAIHPWAVHASDSVLLHLNSTGSHDSASVLQRFQKLLNSARQVVSLGKITYPTRRVVVPQQPAASNICGYCTACNFGAVLALAQAGVEPLLYSHGKDLVINYSIINPMLYARDLLDFAVGPTLAGDRLLNALHKSVHYPLDTDTLHFCPAMDYTEDVYQDQLRTEKFLPQEFTVKRTRSIARSKSPAQHTPPAINPGGIKQAQPAGKQEPAPGSKRKRNPKVDLHGTAPDDDDADDDFDGSHSSSSESDDGDEGSEEAEAMLLESMQKCPTVQDALKAAFQANKEKGGKLKLPKRSRHAPSQSEFVQAQILKVLVDMSNKLDDSSSSCGRGKAAAKEGVMQVIYDRTPLYKELRQIVKEDVFINRLHILGAMCELAEVDSTDALQKAMGQGSLAEGQICYKENLKKALMYTRGQLRYKGQRKIWAVCIQVFGAMEMPEDAAAAAAREAKLSTDSRAAFTNIGEVAFGEAYLSEGKRQELLKDNNFIGGKEYNSPVLVECLITWLNHIGELKPPLAELKEAGTRDVTVFTKEVAFVITTITRWLMGSNGAKGGNCRNKEISTIHDLQYKLFVEALEQLRAAKDGNEFQLEAANDVELADTSSRSKAAKRQGAKTAQADGVKAGSRKMATLVDPV